jgi:protein-S-isoprenylcysteine O-methyltransferase Ste14
MKRIIGFAYSLIAFGIGAAANLYLIGFLANSVVPMSIDSGAPDPLGTSVLVNVGLLGLFGFQHSLMARQSIKQQLTRWIPDQLIRSTYVLFSGVVLALLFWLWHPIPGEVWSVENSLGQVVLWGGFGAGWILLGVASDTIDALHLNGLRQGWAYLKNQEYSAPDFQTPGLYQYTRHPIMLGFLIVFWATPHMTVGHLLFAAVMTIYIMVGIFFEERALVRAFGDRYREYRQETPILIPGLG